VYRVDTHTQPVWLGSAGWAYIDPQLGNNAGCTITVVHAVAHTGAYSPPEYTYAVRGACIPFNVPHARIVSCFKHVASSIQRYTVSGLRE
jgi:hypothetical protein